ncbi:MAG TPA: hypothetical protein VK530_07315 [Candidatus Acidoferrum sp.]|nr:hypothetical protein [Candidatus Acidoferrum sp.]
MVSAACLWFVTSQWFPVIADAIQSLPGQSVIQNSRLNTGTNAPRLLAGNRRLEISLDPRKEGGVSGAADVRVILTVRSLQFCGVLGCAVLEYEHGYVITLSRSALAPRWDAWREPVAILFSIALILQLLVNWWLLGTIVTPIVKLIAFLTDREVTWGGSWRVGNAALLPGAFIVVLGVVLYGLNAIDLFQFALFYALHLVCDIAFVCTSPFFLPKIGAADRLKNPFSTKPVENPAEPGVPPKDSNPFRS